MNYYERHIGDYIRDTVGLSMLEDGAYSRLLDQLYQTEKPLPLDRKEVYRMARATSTAERKAVDYVVDKFFEKTDEGFTQKRAMEILTDYWDRPEQPEKKNSKEGNRDRQRKSRERRKAMFATLADHGVVLPYNTPMRDLEAELSRITSQKTGDTSQPVTRDIVTPVMAAVMGNHSPLTKIKEEPPIPPTGGNAPGDEKSAKPKRSAIGLPAFLQDCRETGVKPIPEGDAVFEYAEKVGIPLEFLRLHWLEFKTRYSDPDAKRYKDWRAVYRKSVRGNWLKLWFFDSNDDAVLTTAGLQAKRAHEEAA